MSNENDILNTISFENDENSNENTNQNDILNNLNLVEEVKEKDEEIDILKSVEENSKLTEFVEEIKSENNTNEEVKNTNIIKKTNIVLSGIIFLFKYILTSSFIFLVLLFATNYNAYIEIARSYLSPETLENTKN
jgi:hypothetical protein